MGKKDMPSFFTLSQRELFEFKGNANAGIRFLGGTPAKSHSSFSDPPQWCMNPTMATKAEPREIRPGIFQLELPTPYPIGPVYVYLVKQEPLSLIDAGVNSSDSLETLKKHLNHLGVKPQNIQKVLITHGHSDHYGAAQTLRDMGAGPVYIHFRDRDKVTHRRDYYLRMKPYLAQMGMPPDYLDYFVKFIVWETPYARDVEEVQTLRDGDLLFWEDLKLEVMYTPGHSPGHVVFFQPQEEWAITGDFIFTHITPDPIIDVTPSGFRTPSMPLHMEALKRFSQRGIHTFYPAHRETEGHTQEALEALKKRMAYKKEMYLDILSQGPMTPFQLMRRLYPESKKGEAFVLLSEVMGRLDLLETEGRVKAAQKDGVLIYALKDTP